MTKTIIRVSIDSMSMTADKSEPVSSADLDVIFWLNGIDSVYRFTLLSQPDFATHVADWHKWEEIEGIDVGIRVEAEFAAGAEFALMNYVAYSDEDRPFLPDIVINSDQINRELAEKAIVWYFGELELGFDRCVFAWKPMSLILLG
ncbi:hypothetical protein COT97_01040 [Candidatus Falkowbacteria bacterium CG10_big_fil_rev_8_21_14_0_10_39_11]|uniref:Uncharacterized protein n=1 Tax=Candidatus Falkowbacteria bacterium CG10_big_fil_rev_8_21_14_0_10_39_11 TaxID=1974565 RepID=A0A2H0V5Y2_9BACT|nr:MAG: hypothetical protein COT97_01040 [Candidatus Falkowbacteria bacterium CG10_big_fil_rev_8_21_14_0_10_39_11]